MTVSYRRSIRLDDALKALSLSRDSIVHPTNISLLADHITRELDATLSPHRIRMGVMHTDSTVPSDYYQWVVDSRHIGGVEIQPFIPDLETKAEDFGFYSNLSTPVSRLWATLNPHDSIKHLLSSPIGVEIEKFEFAAKVGRRAEITLIVTTLPDKQIDIQDNSGGLWKGEQVIRLILPLHGSQILTEAVIRVAPCNLDGGIMDRFDGVEAEIEKLIVQQGSQITARVHSSLTQGYPDFRFERPMVDLNVIAQGLSAPLERRIAFKIRGAVHSGKRSKMTSTVIAEMKAYLEEWSESNPLTLPSKIDFLYKLAGVITAIQKEDEQQRKQQLFLSANPISILDRLLAEPDIEFFDDVQPEGVTLTPIS
jgi:hypothetical protein